MSMKKVTMKMPAKKTDGADAWVNARTADVSESAPAAEVVNLHPVEAVKRLTIDVPEGLHKRIKAACAMRGTKMADVIRDMLDKAFPVA